jgi:hypothetical protein
MSFSKPFSRKSSSAGNHLISGLRIAYGSFGKFLVTLKSESPELFSELEGLSLKEGALELRLTNGILIDWGPIDEKNIFDKAKNILRLLHQYTPVRVPAKMSFVTAERIVMDSNWK